MKEYEKAIEFEKYYGDRKYKLLQEQLDKRDYTKEEKRQMLKEMIKTIKEKKFKLYHDFMDYISENNSDWFNMLTFNRKENRFILEYIKSKVRTKY